MKKTILLLVFSIFCFIAKSQEIPRFNPDTIKTIQLDSVVNIIGKKFGVETFIQAIINDTSFYQAFRNMKKYSFIAENRVYTYDKENKVDGKVYRKIRHNNDGPYKMEFLEVVGNASQTPLALALAFLNFPENTRILLVIQKNKYIQVFP